MADFARGELLTELREARHLSQEDAAHEIGVSTKTLRAWEHGGKIRWPNAKRAGAFYETDPERLVSREQDDAFTEREGASPDQLDRIEQLLWAIAQKIGAGLEPEELAQAYERASEASPPARAQKRRAKAKPPEAPTASE